MRDDHGSVTELMVDDKGEIAVLGLPLDTEVYIEESTVPNGFFPNPAYKVCSFLTSKVFITQLHKIALAWYLSDEPKLPPAV